MAKKRQKPARPRDPAWKMRRALGASRIPSAKKYDRKKLPQPSETE